MNVTLSIRYIDQNGQARTSQRRISRLNANEARLINTGLISPQGNTQISVLSATLIES